MTLIEFLLARISEDEIAARAVPPLTHNFDMGKNRQDERFTFGRTLPSSADGMGNWSEHQNSPTTRVHFARWNPRRVLAECVAKRRIVAEWRRADEDNRRAYGVNPKPSIIVRALALPYADHPDYQQEWAL